MPPPELSLTDRSSPSNLAFALFCLPRERRHDALLFYRFCRTIDDIADEPGGDPAGKAALLQRWLEAESYPPELENLIARYGIARSLLHEIIRGCAMDLTPHRFKNFEELEGYCWRVACAVGLVSIRIFGCRDARSEEYAVQLGHALQLTNILRDVGVDAREGRIYLPMDVLNRNGVKETDILEGRSSPGLIAAMKDLSLKARQRFAAAIPPSHDHRALLPARIMRAIYEKILDRIEKNHFDLTSGPVRLKKWEKLATAAQVILMDRQIS